MGTKPRHTGDFSLNQNAAVAVAELEAGFRSAVNGLTAHAGGGQASGTALTHAVNRVTTVATAGDSVKLPAALAGATVLVKNTAANSMDVFPATGEKINASAANAAFAVAAGKSALFMCAVDGTWDTILTA